MQFKMAENSIFAVLLRSPWWAALAVAAAIALVAGALLPEAYRVFGMAGALPFVVISVLAARRQLRSPGTKRVAQTEAACRAMSRRDFTEAVGEALSRDGHTITPVEDANADFVAEKAGRRTLVSVRRWKAASTGVEPIRALHAASDAHDTHDAMFVALGEISDAARRHAAANAVRLIDAEALTRLLAGERRR